MMEAWWMFIWAMAGSCVLFAVAFLLARRIDNYGVVDVVWSYAFALLAIWYAISSDGWEPRRWALAAIAVIWSARLGTHLAKRVAKHHPTEDTRYQSLREDWENGFAVKMFGFFQMQAISVPIVGLPFLLGMQPGLEGFHVLEIAGLVIWFIGIVGESIADMQLAAFQNKPDNRGKVCDVGLWRYSRHPNYFFEWVIWVGFGAFSLAASWGWIGLVGPAAILYLLLYVTGVPTAEKQSLKSRGEAYRRYQETTSAFVPWFRHDTGGQTTSCDD